MIPPDTCSSTSKNQELEFAGAKHTLSNSKLHSNKSVFQVAFAFAFINLILELSNSEMCVTMFFFRHLGVQICCQQNFHAFRFCGKHLKLSVLYLRMRIQHQVILICVQMDLFQIFIETRNAYIKCQIIIFNTQNASHKSNRNEGTVHVIAYGDPHGRNVFQNQQVWICCVHVSIYGQQMQNIEFVMCMKKTLFICGFHF